MSGKRQRWLIYPLIIMRGLVFLSEVKVILNEQSLHRYPGQCRFKHELYLALGCSKDGHRYQADRAAGFVNTCPLDRDLSDG